MAKYVKVCPRCGHPNDELADACERDGEFLGMVPATLGREESSVPDTVETPPAEPAASTAPTSSEGQTNVAVTQRFDQPTQALYLETSVGQTYEVRHGNVLGQAHPTSSAHIQLADLPGMNYVHRSHCLFEFRDNAWRVTAIAQPVYTNPMFVNQKRLEPGQHAALRNGDRLILSNVVLNVRIIDL